MRPRNTVPSCFTRFPSVNLQDSVKLICDFNESLNPIIDYITCCEILLDAGHPSSFKNAFVESIPIRRLKAEVELRRSLVRRNISWTS